MAGFYDSSVGEESTCNAGDHSLIPGLGRDRVPTPVLLSIPYGSAIKESACNVGDLGSSLGWEDPLEKGKATYSSILAWRIPWTVHGIVKGRTCKSDFHFITCT